MVFKSDLKNGLATIVGSFTIYFIILYFVFNSEFLRRFIARGMEYGPQLLSTTCLALAALIVAASYHKKKLTLEIKYKKLLLDVLPVFLLLFSLLVYTFPVIAVWTKGAVTDAQRCSAYCGYLPWSDAGGYYWGAQNLHYEGKLDDWNSRRPLNALFLNARLALTGQNFKGAILMQAILMGISSFLFSWTVGRILGIGSGLIAFSIVYSFGWQFTPITLSEALGLTLGLLSATLLLKGIWIQSNALLSMGVFFTTVALNARAGAFFILPMILLATCVQRRYVNWRRAVLLSSAIVLAFMLNMAARGFYQGSERGHGNFSLVLYGIVSGKPGWKQIYHDFPDVKSMPENARNDFAMKKSVELIKSEPTHLLNGLYKITISFVKSYYHVYSLFPTNISIYIADIAIIGLIIGSIRSWRHRLGEPLTAFQIACMTGIFASGPIIMFDGGFRVFAASIPLVALFFSEGVRGLLRRDAKSDSCSRPSLDVVFSQYMPIFILAFIFITASFLPYFSSRAFQQRTVTLPITPPWQSIVIETWSTMPHLKVFPQGSAQTFAPRYGLQDFASMIAIDPHPEEFDEALRTKNNTVILAREATSGDALFIIGEQSMVDRERRLLLVLGRHISEGVFKVHSYRVVEHDLLEQQSNDQKVLFLPTSNSLVENRMVIQSPTSATFFTNDGNASFHIQETNNIKAIEFRGKLLAKATVELTTTGGRVLKLGEKSGKAMFDIPHGTAPISKITLHAELVNMTLGEAIEIPPPFHREVGECWIATLPTVAGEGDSMTRPRKSHVRLYEGETLLGPPHSYHDGIRNSGAGTFSHWNDLLLFSTSDNSDPNSNGRKYFIRVPRDLDEQILEIELYPRD